MKIAVLANDEQWKELTESEVSIGVVRVKSLQDEADAYIVLDSFGKEALMNLQKPVLLNSVNTTLKELETAGNVLRFNGWNSFLQRKTWDIAGRVTEEMKTIFTALQKQYIEVADETGLIAARPISMIINEAYFALGEKVSTKEEIDIAMKLGTNYPFGPFEWGRKIGVKNIYSLLSLLCKTDKRYLPASLLQKEATV